MQYTYFLDGKRFRPFLSYLVSKALKKSFSDIVFFAMAIECIHTYSLIHDDLPSLDNDDFRRGKPSNHIIFGEDIALLSGDALLTEAFFLVTQIKNCSPEAIVQVIQMLSNKVGAHGMAGGQVLDMKVDASINLDQLETIHLLKTANLIEASVVGAARLFNATDAQLEKLSVFSSQLGIAFQIKDDLLDGLDSNQDYKNYIQILGLEKTNKELYEKSQKALAALEQADLMSTDLKKIITFNVERQK
jgi:geranylgeranyl diphosphate synthase type II